MKLSRYLKAAILMCISSVIYYLLTTLDKINLGNEEPLAAAREEEMQLVGVQQNITQFWFKLEEAVKNSRKRIRPPDVIGVGVGKCGTGAMVGFLKYHPLIVLPKESPETEFFLGNNGRKLIEYARLFPPASPNQVVMEKTPSYFTVS